VKLTDFAKYIDPVILDRGRDYVLNGNIQSIHEKGELTFQAKVVGSETYSVYVDLDEEGQIISLDCDCPYDFGPVCKHQAAVLLQLRNEWGGPKEGFGVMANPQKDLQELLEAQSKETLIQLLLSLAADSDLTEQRIKLHLSPSNGDVDLEECRSLIQTYIHTYSDHRGFVNFRNVSRAVEGAELVVEKAVQEMDDDHFVLAVKLHLLIVEEMLELLQAAYDSGGTIGMVIEESLESIQEITQSNRLSQTEMEELFHLLLKESAHSRFEGWSDWQLALLDSASQLANTADMKRKWEEYTDAMISRKEDSWSKDYFAERIAMFRYHIVQEDESGEQAAEFLKGHLQFPQFRKLAIYQALENERYEEAIHLASQGIELDQTNRLPGLVKQWKEFLYEAYERSRQLDLQRETGEELVIGGDYSYYQKIKKTYPFSEWPIIYRRILDKLEKDSWNSWNNLYTRILIEEQENARLLEFVQKHSVRIEDFYEHLIEPFPREVKELLEKHIEKTTSQSTNRKDYQHVCRIIRMLARAGGQEEADQCIHQLLAKYPRKPAFREELMKLRVNV
jgi:hypothetical protein